MNKLTIEEQFLNFSQAKELKYLGIDFENGNYLIWNESEEIIAKSDILGFIGDDYTPTLSVAEMIEMLPLDVEAKSEQYGNQTVYLSIDRRSVMYCVSGIEFDRSMYIYISFEKPLLRDALFEMLKWLKQNNLI